MDGEWRLTFRFIASLEELVRHGLLALRDTLQQDKELNIHNTSLAIVGKDKKFQIIEGEDLQPYLEMLGDESARSRRSGTTAAQQSTTTTTTENSDVAPMDTDA